MLYTVFNPVTGGSGHVSGFRPELIADFQAGEFVFVQTVFNPALVIVCVSSPVIRINIFFAACAAPMSVVKSAVYVKRAEVSVKTLSCVSKLATAILDRVNRTNDEAKVLFVVDVLRNNSPGCVARLWYFSFT